MSSLPLADLSRGSCFNRPTVFIFLPTQINYLIHHNPCCLQYFLSYLIAIRAEGHLGSSSSFHLYLLLSYPHLKPLNQLGFVFKTSHSSSNLLPQEIWNLCPFYQSLINYYLFTMEKY